MALASPSIVNSTLTVDIDSRREILLIVGPLFLGTVFNWFLLGALTMQVYVYYFCFPRDHWWIKLNAYGLYLLEIVQTVLVTEIAWADLCAGWGIPSALLSIDWGFSMTPVASGLIACWVQIFFAWRVWALGHNMFWMWIATVILLISFAQGSAAVNLGVKLSSVEYLNNRTEDLVLIRDIFFFYLSASAVADFLIAASLVYFLISTKRKASWSKESDRRITKLIRSTCETGTLCSLVAIIDLIVYLRVGYNSVHISVVMVLSKLYSNALMASLNSRAGVYVSESREETRTTRFNTAQFTSVGVPITTDDFGWMNGKDGQSSESEYVKTGRTRADTIVLTNLGRV
ncbi:hypothetical protein DFH94DRAFT_403736 [Russula ochroleuca]|uniref:DUF6534 domain-containing protein n=1 Tax=Russula ochroleuca TaxID=152965 RepID=A0A9P5MY11_9AGAM|nr:hypothetical protein DFH94DRAFT_403736 [Russula ochroleuca]